MRIAVVGAGMAGLTCAAALAAAGHAVRLFDKGRGAGGRMSTRRIATPLCEAAFDHGAQYLTARDPDFAAEVERWATAGLAARWPVAGDDAWVGTPAMNAPVRALAADRDVAWGVRVEDLLRDGGGWRVRGRGLDAGPFDAVAVAVPAEQATPLLAPHAPAFAALAEQTVSAPCWTAMAAFGERLPAPDVLRHAGAIGWAARDTAKPGRGGPESWVVQATADWSAAHLEDEGEAVAAALLSALGEAVGAALPMPATLAAHRWRYARSGTLGRDCLWDAAAGLGACGDWLLGPRVESAWLSGRRLAAMIG